MARRAHADYPALVLAKDFALVDQNGVQVNSQQSMRKENINPAIRTSAGFRIPRTN